MLVTPYLIMKNKSMIANNKTLNLKNFDIVLINYVEESKKDELLRELKELYGEYKPIEIGVATIDPSFRSPDLRLGKKIIYYDEVNDIKKALPEKFESLEIRIVNHISSWCEVICKGRLKREHLEKAKEEFLERIDRENTVSTPKTFEEAHKELENYLSPHIMDNILHKREYEKRRSYPYLYIGELDALSSNNLMEIINETDYTRDGLGWFAQRWGSIIERHYLVEQIGGGQQGLLISRDLGFSVLNISPMERGEKPSSWNKDTVRRFKATSPEYWIIDTISWILFSNILFTYRLERIKDWEKENISLSSKIKEQSIKFDWEEEGSADNVKEIIGLQREMARLRSAFLGESFNLRNECEELDNPIKSSFEYLLSRDFDNFPIEEPFFHPINAEKDFIEGYIRSGNPKKGVLLNVIEDSQRKKEELLKKISKIEEEQKTLTSHVHDILNINLQKRMGTLTEENLALNKSVKTLTKWIVTLTIVMISLIIIQIMVGYRPDLLSKWFGIIWHSVT